MIIFNRTASSKLLTIATVATILSLVTLLQACIPLAVTAVGAGVLVATDRRSAATQATDKEIQFKAGNALETALTLPWHVNITPYNRIVLLTGEVSSEADKKLAEDTVNRIVNVRSVINELQIGPPTSISSRSNDVYINGKIKATFVDAKDLFANSFKIVVENSEVFLLGLVTDRELDSAADLASRVKGVSKVVKVAEIITENDLKRMGSDPAHAVPQSATPSATGTTPSASPPPTTLPSTKLPSPTALPPVQPGNAPITTPTPPPKPTN